MNFRFTADVTYDAEDIDAAMMHVAMHLLELVYGTDTDHYQFAYGQLNIKPEDDPS